MEPVETIRDAQLTEPVLELVWNCKNDITRLIQTMYPCRNGTRRGVVLDTILLLALGEGMLELAKENAELKCQLEERRFQIHFPIEKIKLLDVAQQVRFSNQNDEQKWKSISRLQREIDSGEAICYLHVLFK